MDIESWFAVLGVVATCAAGGGLFIGLTVFCCAFADMMQNIKAIRTSLETEDEE